MCSDDFCFQILCHRPCLWTCQELSTATRSSCVWNCCHLRTATTAATAVPAAWMTSFLHPTARLCCMTSQTATPSQSSSLLTRWMSPDPGKMASVALATWAEDDTRSSACSLFQRSVHNYMYIILCTLYRSLLCQSTRECCTSKEKIVIRSIIPSENDCHSIFMFCGGLHLSVLCIYKGFLYRESWWQMIITETCDRATKQSISLPSYLSHSLSLFLSRARTSKIFCLVNNLVKHSTLIIYCYWIHTLQWFQG